MLNTNETGLNTPDDPADVGSAPVASPKPPRKSPTPAPYDPRSTIIWRRHLRQAAGVSPVTAWRLEKVGDFPSPIRLTAGRIGWRREDIERWLQAREAK